MADIIKEDRTKDHTTQTCLSNEKPEGEVRPGPFVKYLGPGLTNLHGRPNLALKIETETQNWSFTTDILLGGEHACHFYFES